MLTAPRLTRDEFGKCTRRVALAMDIAIRLERVTWIHGGD